MRSSLPGYLAEVALNHSLALNHTRASLESGPVKHHCASDSASREILNNFVDTIQSFFAGSPTSNKTEVIHGIPYADTGTRHIAWSRSKAFAFSYEK